MRTARCVASHTVPSSNTTPSSSSATIAPPRCSGDSMAVTKIVARNKMYMAPRVMATTRMVVKIEAKIIFMELTAATTARDPKHSASAAKSECEEAGV